MGFTLKSLDRLPVYVIPLPYVVAPRKEGRSLAAWSILHRLQGKYLVLAGFKGMGGPDFTSGLNGQLEFVSADDLETLDAAEHFLASVIEWDPTGRYIATSVVNQAMENGVTFWQFDGHELFRCISRLNPDIHQIGRAHV